MKKLLLGIVIGVLAGGVAVWSILQRHEHHEKDEAKEEKHEESHIVHGTNGETSIKFDAAAQEKMGLKTASLRQADHRPEVKAMGRVMDPAPIATALADMAIAKTQVEASAREFERVKLLFGQNQNVSARAMEAAELAVRRDKLAFEAARLRFAALGSAIAEMKDIEGFVQAAGGQRAALVRVDVPAGEALGANISGARIATLHAPEQLLGAEYLGAAPNVDPQAQGQGYLFVLRTNGLPANAAVNALISLEKEIEHGVEVPREAVVRHEGETFVYLQSGADTFQRKEIDLETPVPGGWFTEALKPDTRVVVTGAQQLLSEEFKVVEAE